MKIQWIPRPQHVTQYGGVMTLCGDPVLRQDDSLPPEGYTVTLRGGTATLTYADDGGKYYALQTFARLRQPDGSYPCLAVEDAPQYAYRAFMVDSARHLQTVDELKAVIEAAAALRFNYFHWHLTDDQGWRIESTVFPQLNEIGSFRAEDGFGNKDGRRYGGYFTKDEIRDIVAFCAERQITVIPEVDMPGHTVALMAAFPQLSCTGKVTAVSTKIGIHKDILCAGNEETFETVFRILDEVCDLFPGELFHIGGDEAPKLRWTDCEKCKARLQAEGLSGFEQLQGYFTNRVAAYLKTKGKRAVTWNESLKSGTLDNDVVVCNWMDKANDCVRRANSGGKVIEEDFFHYYLDYPYGMTPLKKTYTFDPMRKGLTAEGRNNIIGVEAPLWTEFVRDFDRFCYMMFPRLMAVAERGWTAPALLDYKSFTERAKAMLPALAACGVTAAPAGDWDPRGLERLRSLHAHRRAVFHANRADRRTDDE